MKKKFLVAIIGLLLVLSMFTMLIACANSQPSAFVGKWEPESGQRVPSDFPEDNMELFKDGTGVGDRIALSWKVENKRFVVTLYGRGYVYDYKISGKRLTLSDGYTTVIYKKK